MSKEIPALVVTNPIWLFLFRHGVEDPNWGRRPIDQHTIATTIHELATMITHDETRKQIQSSAANLMANTAQEMIREYQTDEKSS